MDLTLRKVARRVYTILDFLRDMGGLAGTLHSLAVVCLTNVLFQAAYLNIGTELFQFKEKKQTTSITDKTKQETIELKQKFRFNFLDYAKHTL